MFARLSERLQNAARSLRGKGKVGPTDVKRAMREVRIALLEADVHFSIVKDFVDRVTERALGKEVLAGLNAGQQVIEVVQEELTVLMGGDAAELVKVPKPRRILLVGLQGAGKTTTAGKLARYLVRQGRTPHLVAADVHRPAAVHQLEVLAKQVGVVCTSPVQGEGAVSVAARGHEEALSSERDDVVIDTAGRLHIDAVMMDELRQVAASVKPDEVLLVVDSMTGQDAVQVARTFHEQITLTGVILTKLDADVRGGAALSVRSVTGCPIKLVGTGERIDDLESFFPDRMASRILGMGDVLTLIEKARSAVDEREARAMEERLLRDEFTIDDLLGQIEKFRSMGTFKSLISMMPGMNVAKLMPQLEGGEREFDRIRAMARSMTVGERAKPEIINASRRRRIANGSGTTVTEVNRLLKTFAGLRVFLGQMVGTAKGKRRNLTLPIPPSRGSFRKR
ncbi:signal recognition particle protein [Pasteuria penetrans]|uniref:signal recognition particle protein n=1 Tax=Pasteuria penetrans TaxID=86005 RepID=UPI000FAD2821|nr:signal recognition particle protein [Pasteuria penetrans]